MDTVYDVIGIGIGPSNLGLAAMCNSVPQIKSLFFDKKDKFTWHPGVMFENSILQTHYLKDLITPVDPTSKFTFISYLHAQNRLFQFINRKSDSVPRKEFELYYQWVCSQLTNLTFASPATKVEYDDHQFTVLANKKKYHAKNISCGVGHTPFIPSIFAKHLGENVFHGIFYKNKLSNVDITGKNIVIIGGGQSGAELFYDLICKDAHNTPAKVTWISNRLNFQPVEDASFNREIFTPYYNDYFYSLPEFSQEMLLKKLQLSGNGIDPDLLDNLYRKLYDLKYLFNSTMVLDLLPAHRVTAMSKANQQYQLEVTNKLSGTTSVVTADMVICATGFKFEIPSCLQALITSHDLKNLAKDYSITLNNSTEHKIYIQNGAKHTHGLADPYLSTSAWRNATIMNSILKSDYYDNKLNVPLFSWQHNDTNPDIFVMSGVD